MAWRWIVVWSIVLVVAPLGGCVERVIRVTSEPPGAIVWLNDREVGRTPVDVRFLHYGTYDVRLEKAGYEPALTTGDANAPWWDIVGPDLVAEAVPGAKSTVEWHYVLVPKDDDAEAARDALVHRARELREAIPPPPEDETAAVGDTAAEGEAEPTPPAP